MEKALSEYINNKFCTSSKSPGMNGGADWLIYMFFGLYLFALKYHLS